MSGRQNSPSRQQVSKVSQAEESSLLGSALTTRHIEAFGRKVTSTASTLIGDPSNSPAYRNAMREIQKELQRPGLQRSVFSYANASPTEIVRSKLSRNEIQHRALSTLPDEIILSIPEDKNVYSLFQGFQATLPEPNDIALENSRGQKINGAQRLLKPVDESELALGAVAKIQRQQSRLSHRLEMMLVRKNMCSSEIREIDAKISNLNQMRKIVLNRLEDLEREEGQMEQDLSMLDDKLAEELEHEEKALDGDGVHISSTNDHTDEPAGKHTASFMSASIYDKMPSPRSRRPKQNRRKSTAIRHGHFDPGTVIAEFDAHSDMITALDFDVPFGTMVSSALDDTVRVWDLNLQHCIGFLEGHHASVRCLQIDDHMVATGSMDASIRLWDLNNVEYTPRSSRPRRRQSTIDEQSEHEDDDDNTNCTQFTDDDPVDKPQKESLSSTTNCHVHTLSAHVAEVTALHLQGDTLISGSADKTLRQWDLVKGRCVQTLDVLWAAAQASASINTSNTSSRFSEPFKSDQWSSTGPRTADPAADFVGALQCFDAALACGTADGMIRLWDLRSGQVQRSLVGHTGAITCLQFDERLLVTGSADRSIRIWDLRTGAIRDAYGYDHAVTSMMFDTRRIAAATGESVVKIFDRMDGRHWECGGSATEGLRSNNSLVEKVRIKDGYLVEGRKNGVVGVWSV